MKIYLAIIAAILIALAIPGYRYMSDYRLETRLEEYGCNVAFNNNAVDRLILGKRPNITIHVVNVSSCMGSLKLSDFTEALKDCDVKCIWIYHGDDIHAKPDSFDLAAALREKSFKVDFPNDI